MDHVRAPAVRGLMPLLLGSGVVVFCSLGLSRGAWLPNLHNGLLGLAFTAVGSYVVLQRPGHREGRLFLATGALESLVYFGRQIGHFPHVGESRWWGWLGVWPTVAALAVTTMSVLCFPDGRLPSRRWRGVALAVVVIAAWCAVLSALWPVEYDATAVLSGHPIHATSPGWASDAWSAVAHPAYAGFQVLWVVAVAARWRTADALVRRQLSWLIGAATFSVAALLVGLLVAASPRAGLLAATLVPVAAGLAIVHGQHATAYSALSWLSRAEPDREDLPTGLARAVAGALRSPSATLWMGADDLHAVGVWPESDDPIPPTGRLELERSRDQHARLVTRRGATVGALSVTRPRDDALSLTEARLFSDLASQAALVLDHMGLAEIIARERRAGHLEGLSERERDVLELMARGRSNAAICEELHLSIKTVEPIVSTIFAKLGLHPDAQTNRRVLAVLAYRRSETVPS